MTFETPNNITDQAVPFLRRVQRDWQVAETEKTASLGRKFEIIRAYYEVFPTSLVQEVERRMRTLGTNAKFWHQEFKNAQLANMNGDTFLNLVAMAILLRDHKTLIR